MNFIIETWGKFACFTRPEFGVERYSYDVITPSAAKGLFESVYWHPGMDWIIDRIMVCNPIKFTQMTRNEITKVLPFDAAKSAYLAQKPIEPLIVEDQVHTQRSSVILQDVRYIIQAHVEFNEKRPRGLTEEKVRNIFWRRLVKGQHYRSPYFGIREYCANVKYCSAIPPVPDELRGTKDLGMMLYERDYSKSRPDPIFFHAIMRDGVIEVPYLRKGASTC